ncbi:Beta-1,3-glucuronyltransferase 2 (Glucuronosyltransferase S) [Puccinia graminis f. sp. tritici]|uniref:Beta-1,3-glucuronyltransferase 2 (Glucuronosyltransferase S) n=1 Tax=Puccinia graminis f. sp. tritici TaxID=56615 RepID=A0A5B0MID2_PUCGR|nr:Beta-1,3-glucuronyltransferase 2 (Glucuronosyltransferase S) [Puccinia graminis f. sp. tritici]
MTHDLVTLLISFGFMALENSAWMAIVPLFSYSRVEDGGLGLTLDQISLTLSSNGVIALVVQSILFPILHRRLGVVHLHRISRFSSPIAFRFFGHGPINPIDDDSIFLPELLVIIWDIQRIGVWPMGNLGPNGWEGPVHDPSDHTLFRWEAGAVQDRKFPVDNGAFAFASELLGTRYWPTDISGGENEFIGLIVDKKEDIEPLCYNCIDEN